MKDIEIFKLELLGAIQSSIETDWFFDGEDEVPYEKFDAENGLINVLSILKKYNLIKDE